uniref:Uncharacterized protein n=1 Tax=viral metagenome TaxID=1070528 RepID=A0A6C0II93_9ZZZZ
MEYNDENCWCCFTNGKGNNHLEDWNQKKARVCHDCLITQYTKYSQRNPYEIPIEEFRTVNLYQIVDSFRPGVVLYHKYSCHLCKKDACCYKNITICYYCNGTLQKK